MAEVIAFAEVVRRRRRRVSRELHGRCVEILRAAVGEARVDLARAPARERWVRAARLRKLEDLHAYASTLG